MQTFLPYADFTRSARSLDQRRLGKQRVEVIQIVRALTRPGYGWGNHPAVLMWRGFEEGLARYGFTCCEVWTERGFADTCADTIAEDVGAAGVTAIRSYVDLRDARALPAWLGDDTFHRGHQSALIRKDPDHYSAQFPGVPDDLPYVWPVRSAAVVAAEERKLRRAAERTRKEAEAAARRRSLAAKRGWQSRRARLNLEGPDRA